MSNDIMGRLAEYFKAMDEQVNSDGTINKQAVKNKENKLSDLRKKLDETSARTDSLLNTVSDTLEVIEGLLSSINGMDKIVTDLEINEQDRIAKENLDKAVKQAEEDAKVKAAIKAKLDEEKARELNKSELLKFINDEYEKQTNRDDVTLSDFMEHIESLVDDGIFGVVADVDDVEELPQYIRDLIESGVIRVIEL